jgi:hypothetical protein
LVKNHPLNTIWQAASASLQIKYFFSGYSACQKTVFSVDWMGILMKYSREFLNPAHPEVVEIQHVSAERCDHREVQSGAVSF